ncbi:hypothetical protein GEMRC1_005928 [Eukaryota sp. GEM-RC1]
MLSDHRLRTFLTDNRSVVIIASALIQISLGVNYSFPTIIPFLTSQYDWTTKETQAVWSCVQIVEGLAPMLAPFLLKFYSFRFLTTCSSLLMFFGYTIASFAGGVSFISIALGLGLFVAGSVGISYIVALKICLTYFPNKKGAISGLVAGMFGSGSLIWSFLVEQILKTNSPQVLFRVFSLTAPLIIFLAGLFMVTKTDEKTNTRHHKKESKELEPIVDDNEIPSIQKSASVMSALSELSMIDVVVEKTRMKEIDEELESDSDACSRRFSVISEREIEPIISNQSTEERLYLKSLLKMTNFWQCFFTLVIASSAGFMILGALRILPEKKLLERGFSSEEAKMWTLMATAVSFNLGNGIVRILLGQVADLIGAPNTLTLILATQAVSLIVFITLSGFPYVLLIIAFVIASCYGAVYVALPVCVNEIFSEINFSFVYPFVFTGTAFAGFLGPTVYGVLEDLGVGSLSFVIMSCFLLIGVLISLSIKKQVLKKA